MKHENEKMLFRALMCSGACVPTSVCTNVFSLAATVKIWGLKKGVQTYPQIKQS